MLAKIGFELTSMLLKRALRGVEVKLSQFFHPTGLEHPQVLAQGGPVNSGESANLPVRNALTLEPKDLHSPANPRMWIVVA